MKQSKFLKPQSKSTPSSAARKPNFNSTTNVFPTGEKSKQKFNSSVRFVPKSSYFLKNRCDLAYNEYLLQVYLKDKTCKVIAEHKVALNDQISKHNRILFDKQKKLREVENKIEDIETKKNFENSLQVLKKCVDGCVDALKELEIEELLDDLLEATGQQCNSLYIKNIKPLKTQSEYDSLQNEISKTNEVAGKISKVTGDVDKAAVLADFLEKYMNLECRINEHEKIVCTLKNKAEYITAKKVSDMFALNGNY